MAQITKPVFFLFVVTSLFYISCGGGGGSGSDFVGAATVRISATPQRVDTGDQILVEVVVNDVHDDGIALKLRYPSELSYVFNSSFLEVAAENSNIAPGFEGRAGRDNTKTYLVYFFDKSLFGDNIGTVTLQLRADAPIEEGEIEVDSDINVGSFDATAPQFTAQDSVSTIVDAEE